VRRPALVLLGLTALVCACRARGFEPSVRRAMSADAKCPEEQIQVKGLTGGGYQADGCGKSAIYDCTWPEGGTRTCNRRGAPVAPGLPGTGWR